MRKIWIPLLALGVLFVCGCKSDDAAKTADNTTATTTAPDATKPSDAPKPNADAPAADAGATAFVGSWAQKDGGTLDLKADGSFAMGDGKGTTMLGTYKIGGDSKTLAGGKEIKITVTDVKASDPAKQAEIDKTKETGLKIANSQPAASIKVDADGTGEWQDPGSTKIDKMTKKA